MVEQGSEARAVTLGEYLEMIRRDRKMTLRQVEDATKKDVSNAYLSQLENDKIKQPSPHILHTLAGLYGVSYTGLMERAGYIRPQGERGAEERHGRVATFADVELTAEEEAELIRFLRFIRSDRQSTGAT